MHPLFALAAALIVDGHADTPQYLLDVGTDLLEDGEQMVDVPKARRGGLSAEFFSIWVDPELFKAQPARRAFDLIDAVRGQVEKHPGQLALALSAADVERIHAAKKLGVMMGVEGGHAIEADVRILRDFYRLGARYMTLTWSNTNEIGDSSGDIDDPKVPHHGGMTPFGREVVREMNRLGMLVDVSHVSDQTFFDAVKESRAPVIASHSSARALCNHARNMTDEMLRAVGENGGVVMINFFSAFVDESYRKAFTAMRPEFDKAVKEASDRTANDPALRTRETTRIGREMAARIPRPPFSALIDQIEHVARVAGPSHAGLGSDFDGIPSMPQGIDSAADLPKIAQALRQRGFTQNQVAGILGGNLLRVLRAAEKVAAASR
jgi:membrane dipeptidase